MSLIIYRNRLNKQMHKFGLFLKAINRNYTNTEYISSPLKNDFLDLLDQYNSLIICSHGGKDKIYHRFYSNRDKEDQILFDESNVDLVTNKNVIAFSCGTTQVFGPKAIECGCKSYLGFRRSIHFNRDKDQHTSKYFYETVRKCYINSFQYTLEMALSNNLTMGQIEVVLKNKLSKEAAILCDDFEMKYPRRYYKKYVFEVLTTIADVRQNIETLGDINEVLYSI